MRVLIFILILITVGFLIYYFFSSSMKEEKEFFQESSFQLSFKKAVFVIAWRGFRDEEYFVPKQVLEKQGVKVYTASLEKGEAIGAGGKKTKVDLLQDEFDPLDYDALIFVGGPKALDYLDNENSYKMARKVAENNKILGAICISPVVLAKAGVLKGKKATVWSSIVHKEPIEILKENGAIYVNQKVVVDGNIVTGNGPSAAEEFGREIINLLKM